MLARVKLFGPMGAALGQAEVSVSLESDSPTCAVLRSHLFVCEPRLANLLDGCRFAINGRFVPDEQPLSEGDEIALIGFVSGG